MDRRSVAWARRSLRGARREVFWSDRGDRPPARDPLRADTATDLLVVGAGFTGLWAAIQARQRDPGRDVVLVEARRVGVGASSRNGGFVSASLTHGHDHGASSWPQDLDRLIDLGRDNLAAIASTVAEHQLDVGWEAPGQLVVAVRDNQVGPVRESFELHRRLGEDVTWYDAARLRAQLSSPTYLAGYQDRSGVALADPARLVWALADLAERLGVRLVENTEVIGLGRAREQMAVRVRTARGEATVTARDVVLGTNAFPAPLRRLSLFVLPVYDHVLVTEPLSAAQRRSVGWLGRQGVSDGGRQFHYYRLTADDRILWGGYDANYHRGGAVDVALEQNERSHLLLARHFVETFPQLEGLRFTHRWGGAIDTTSRFTPTFGTAFGGRVAYAVGYTGLGVGSSRWGAQVALDLLTGAPSELTELAMVRRPPVPFPPEPLRYPVVAFTRARIARADRTGRPGAWLRALDRVGVGFDS